nr:TetR/AcrR family transcriptional regulator [Kibdelosporangium sp. MJ126-NF4]CEL23230.1 transcriptional regulator, TetR family [Kibdelosporangium sp. MJ126-NF4]CTQ94393.1 transcriptional regulator, TetR family [Kibdelosporangium sp. MJ126-NF4]
MASLPFPAARRRRGEDLLAAIYAAAVAELAESGMAGLTMEAIAARAHTGKASLYRRWPSKEALLVDALGHLMPEGHEEGSSGDLRTDLLSLLRTMAEVLSGPAGPLVRAVMGAVIQNSELADSFTSQFFGARLEPVRRLLRTGVARGEVRPEVVDTDVAFLGPELVLFRFLTYTGPLDEDYLAAVTDDVVLPLLRPAPAATDALQHQVRELQAALAEAHLEIRRMRSATPPGQSGI